MPTMNYSSTAYKEVNPSIIKMTFSIRATDEDANESIKKLSALRKQCRMEIFSKDSLIHESYKQKQISVDKLYKTVSTKVKDGDTEKLVSNRVFDKFRSSTILEFTLKNEDTVIDDFTDILNLAVELEQDCKYYFDITSEETVSYGEELYAQAIDKGISSVTSIIAKTKDLSDLKPIIIEINTQGHNGYACLDAAVPMKTRGAAAPDEEANIITPELVADIFDNMKIVLSKSVELVIDLKSQRAI